LFDGIDGKLGENAVVAPSLMYAFVDVEVNKVVRAREEEVEGQERSTANVGAEVPTARTLLPPCSPRRISSQWAVIPKTTRKGCAQPDLLVLEDVN
jgi:hypothetical protein